MKTYLVQPLIRQLTQQTENILNIAVQQWQMLNPAIFKQQPAPGAWSAMQCIGHLNAYGAYYLPAIEKAIKNAKTRDKMCMVTFKPGWLGNYFTKLMMPDERGIPSRKMEALKNYTITNEGDTDQIIASFIEQQETLLLLLEKAKDADLGGIRIPLSIAKFIKLKPGDVLMFLVAHNIRHSKQAERAIAEANKSRQDRTAAPGNQLLLK